MRHLAEDDAKRTLRRGRPVEVWLGKRSTPGGPSIRWLQIAPTKGGQFAVTVFESADVGTADFFDVYEFPALDPEQPFGVSQTFDSEELALAHAVSLGADPARFVNEGVIQDEYRDARTSDDTE